VAETVAIAQLQEFLFKTKAISEFFTLAGRNYTPFISTLPLVILMEVSASVYIYI
jgi:hypothetical protein